MTDNAFWVSLPDPLPVRELAPLLRVNESTVLRRLQDGTIPGHYIGRSWLIYKSEIRAWLLTRRNTPTDEHVDPDPLAGWPEELRMAELTALFGKTEQTVRRWLEDGAIPGYRIGGRWIAYKSELREVLEASSNQRRS